MKYILHIDTSGDKGLTAISGDGKLIVEKVNDEVRNHASSINADIDFVLNTANITLKDIAAVAVCAGPGSYTGLRIGTSTAKGICYALNKPLMMHNKLTLLSYHALLEGKNNKLSILSILPAREKEYYAALYSHDFEVIMIPQHIYEEKLLSLMSSAPKISINSAPNEVVFNKVKELSIPIFETTEINLTSWIMYAEQQLKCNDFVNLANSEPDYLKKVYTHKPKASK